MFRCIKALVAFFAPPAISHLNYFLVTKRGRTSRIRNVVRFDVHYRCSRRKIFRLIRHSVIGLLDFIQAAHFRTIESNYWRWASTGVCLERLLRSWSVIPTSKNKAFFNIWVDLHSTRAEHWQRTPLMYDVINRTKLTITRVKYLPPKSPTLTPLNAITGVSSTLYCSACFPQRVRRTEKPDLSTRVNSRLGIWGIIFNK